jgi:hypothetical protein
MDFLPTPAGAKAYLLFREVILIQQLTQLTVGFIEQSLARDEKCLIVDVQDEMSHTDLVTHGVLLL